MPRSAGAGSGESSIQMPADNASGDDASAPPEETLSRFVWWVAVGEWAGNALGALVFLWASAVMLGGFCTELSKTDFRIATILTFIEAFRLFSLNYKSDHRTLFGTTRAVKWISCSFLRVLWQPREGNEVVLLLGCCFILTYPLPGYVFQVVLLILMKKELAHLLMARPRRRRRLLCVVQTALLLIYACLSIAAYYFFEREKALQAAVLSCTVAVAQLAALFLLLFRPPKIASLISTHGGRKVLFLAKIISALWLAYGLVVSRFPRFRCLHHGLDPCLLQEKGLISAVAIVVLSLSSLQEQTTANNNWVDFILNVLFLLNFWLLPYPDSFLSSLVPRASEPFLYVLSFITMLAVLLIGNLQIPAALGQVVLSSCRLHNYRNDYPKHSGRNLLSAIFVFYMLVVGQGVFYLLACILGSFSSSFRTSLVRRSKFSDQRRGAKAIDKYYHHAYKACLENSFLSKKNRLSLASFALKSLRSKKSSDDMQLAGLVLLDNLLQAQDSDSSGKLVTRIISSQKVVSTLITMLGWTVKQDRHIRLFAARVTSNLADRLRVAETPGILNLVSSLLDDAKNQPQPASNQPSSGEAQGTSAGSSSSVCQCWHRMKDKWSFPEEPPSAHRDLLPVLGMVILEKLARDPENCAEIAISNHLISKIIGLMSYTADSESSEVAQQQNEIIICSQLNFVRRLAITGHGIGAALRKELQKNPFLLNNLAGILEDACGTGLQLQTLAMDIIAKLSLDSEAGEKIGGSQLIIAKLVDAFLVRHELANIDDDDLSLPMVAGEALANLAAWGTPNCSVILEELGYQVTKDLKNMLSEDKYRYVVASLLQNLCAHSRVKLMSHPDSRGHLSSALTIAMEHIMAAEGKRLECLIGLASQVGDVIPEALVSVLEAQTNWGLGLVLKLVSTLNSNRKPNPKYPRMRRVIVEIVTTILVSCHRTVEKIVAEGVMEGLMEALRKIKRSPSMVEKYRVFYGNVGVVPEIGSPLPDLAARAERLIIDYATLAPSAQSGDNA